MIYKNRYLVLQNALTQILDKNTPLITAFGKIKISSEDHENTEIELGNYSYLSAINKARNASNFNSRV